MNTSADNTSTEPSVEAASSQFQESYEQTAAARAALPADEVRTANLDAYASMPKISGKLPKIKELEADCAKDLPNMDRQLFQNIATFAMAFVVAYARWQATAAPPKAMPELSERLGKSHDLLESNCRTLAKHRLIPELGLAKLNGTAGHRDKVADTMLMSALLKQHWQQIEGKTALTLAFIMEAEDQAKEVLDALGERERAITPSEAADQRDRAFTVFIRAYYELRRGALYVRFYHGDADTFVPLLYVHKRKPGSDVEEPVPAETVNDFPLASAASATSHLPSPAPIPVGMPGSNPLADR